MNSHNSSFQEKSKLYSDKEWLELIKRSVTETVIEGLTFPPFPRKDVQERFVGSSYETALTEAFEFYSFLKNVTAKLGKPLSEQSRIHDFGCGWGRFIRFFMKDVASDNIYGSDVMPLAIDICKQSALPGRFDVLEQDGTLPYPDQFFDVMMAYSVFTHLPGKVHIYWMKELARVSKPEAIFCLTLEPRFFIDRIKHAKEEPSNVFLQALAGYAPNINELYNKFDRGEISYLATGGGDNLTANVYGDAIVPLSFIEKNWSEYFKVISYEDFPDKIWHQARLVVQRKLTKVD
jgi:ubiquinone/menaquinone biosynthesis C-methylase UbiE